MMKHIIYIILISHIIKLQIWTNIFQLTSDVGKAEALGLPGAVGLRVKVKPNTPPGGDEGRRQHGATQPGFPVPCRSQQEPVSQTTSRLGHIKVTETEAEH